MLKTLVQLLLFITVAITLSACKKSDLFNKYARNMSCKIDGERWVPRFTINLETDPVFAATGQTSSYSGQLYLEVIGTRFYHVNDALRRKRIRIYIHPIPRNIRLPYTIQIDSVNRAITHSNTETGNYWYGGDNPNDRGQITITAFDTAKQIFRGNFSCELVNGYGKVVRITEGRFDSKP
jgi:hypothetical protein